MKLIQFVLAASAILAVTAGGVSAHDGSNEKSHRNRLLAVLKPSEEVPVISSIAARGTFKATIDEVNQVISYELTEVSSAAQVRMPRNT